MGWLKIKLSFSLLYSHDKNQLIRKDPTKQTVRQVVTKWLEIAFIADAIEQDRTSALRVYDHIKTFVPVDDYYNFLHHGIAEPSNSTWPQDILNRAQKMNQPQNNIRIEIIIEVMEEVNTRVRIGPLINHQTLPFKLQVLEWSLILVFLHVQNFICIANSAPPCMLIKLCAL